MQKQFFRRCFYFLSLLFCALALWHNAAFAAVNVKNMRLGNQPDGARVVFDLDGKVNYRVFLLDNPKRAVIDLADSNIDKLYTQAKNQVVSGTRVGKMQGNDKRIVIDLSRTAVVKKAFLIPPQSGQNWRLVVDLAMVSDNQFKSKTGNQYALTNNQNFLPQEEPAKSSWWSSFKSDEPVMNETVKKVSRKRIIVLDPGHGGKDPGAIGAYAKTYEKNITLAMGKELQTILRKKGYTVYLTRDNDIFIPLRQRIKIAQKYKSFKY